MQKKAIFFVFDGGSGIGHLRRLASIARELQGDFSCLIVTGHRAAANWFVPEECEYIHLPSWDGLLASKAKYWNREPFMEIDEDDAIRLRKHLIKGIVEAFRPDVIFVDHLPLGMLDELSEIIGETPCLKYLVTRGILNESQDIGNMILGGRALECIRDHYQRVFVALDNKVFDFERQYDVHADLRKKVMNVGYIIDPIRRETITLTRKSRGLSDGDIWVVAAAGGGQLGENLVQSCQELSRRHPNISFDVVIGPRSGLGWSDSYKDFMILDNLHVHRETPYMSRLHASADVVISSGGYNSILETLQGNAKLLCVPSWKSERDEQYVHASNLTKFVDIRLTTDHRELPQLFDQLFDGNVLLAEGDRRRELDFSGASTIKQIVMEDLDYSGRRG